MQTGDMWQLPVRVRFKSGGISGALLTYANLQAGKAEGRRGRQERGEAVAGAGQVHVGGHERCVVDVRKPAGREGREKMGGRFEFRGHQCVVSYLCTQTCRPGRQGGEGDGCFCNKGVR